MSRVVERKLGRPGFGRRILARIDRPVFASMTAGMLVLPLVMAGGLFLSVWELLTDVPFVALFSAGGWNPSRGEISFLPYLAGTLWVTVLAILWTVPLALLSAVYLAAYQAKRLASLLKPAIDVIAGLPSVVFGLWGVILVIPFVRDGIAPVFGISVSGYSILSAAIVLGVMILPLMIQLMTEIVKAVPEDMREAALALGATRWETIKNVTIRKAMPGIIGSVVLALGRAFGETLAVLMVIGGVPLVPSHPLQPAATLPTLIANHFGEMSAVPLYHRLLMTAAFILFLTVAGLTLVSRLVLDRVRRRVA